ncbi:MAG: leucine-rich repeat domain-containing protein [Ruminococcus sp.]|nr:leucine-rich repeat domain-containing protein [Ruminococcus sp.]
MCGSDYIRYELDFSEEGICSVPITNDITEFVGDHEMYIEITSDNEVIGRTNSVNLRVYPFSGLCSEIIRREVYIARIAELEERVAGDDSDFSNIKNAISVTHVPIDDTTPTSEYGNLILSIPRIALSDIVCIIEGTYRGVYEIPYGVTKICDYLFNYSSIDNFIIPATVTEIGANSFANCSNITEFTIPDSVTNIGEYAFDSCSNLTSVNLGRGISIIPYRSFSACTSLQSIVIPENIRRIDTQAFIQTKLSNVNIPHGVQELGFAAFSGVSTITTLTLPNTLTSIEDFVFSGCNKIENVTIENGFNADNLNLNSSTKYSANTIVSWLNALYDRTGLSTYTLEIGAANINKLSSEQIAIATNKNWNLA